MTALRVTSSLVTILLSSSFALGLVQGAEEIDPVQGYWEGEWKLDSGNRGKQTAEVVALGDGQYQAAFTAYDGGELEKQTFRFLINGALVDKQATFATGINLGPLGMFEFKATMKEEQFTARYTNNKEYTGTFAMKRVYKKPDSLLAKPLPGAVVLFDGASVKEWRHSDGTPCSWKLSDGTLQIVPAKDGAANSLASQAAFDDAQIHLEFRTPFLPKARGRARGDSGVFVQGRYEVQIVDSFGQPRTLNNFGLPDDDDSAGAIFKRAAPLENATLPPGEWQTLDITFLGIRRDGAGKVTRPGEISVQLNGRLVQDRLRLDEPTEAAPIQNAATPAGLILQDSGHAVEFRNIWYVPLNAAAGK